MLPSLMLAIPAITVDTSACDVTGLASCGGVEVRVPADETWDDLVARAVAEEWVGLEALTGIPGTVGDAVRRNISRFGASAADAVTSVRTWDRARAAQQTFAAVDCGFSTGVSRFVETLHDGSPRFEIMDIAFLFRHGDLTRPIGDAGLAQLLGVGLGSRVPLTTVRAALVPPVD
ncbi:MAG: FAD-binding protein [Arachnia sp.]